MSKTYPNATNLVKCDSKRFYYFWKETDEFGKSYHPIFSNFTELPQKIKMIFKFDGIDTEILFHNSEAAFHATKAYLFDPTGEEFKKLQETSSPLQAKKIGRKIKNFNQKKWDQQKYKLMYQVLKAKFTQFKSFKKALFDVQEDYFVEASPYDSVWGIGMGANNSQIKYGPIKWKGENLLGKALTNLRVELLKK